MMGLVLMAGIDIGRMVFMKKPLSKRTDNKGHSLEAYCTACTNCPCNTPGIPRGNPSANGARTSR